MKNWRIWTVVALAAALAVPVATAAGKSDDSGLFIRSAVENGGRHRDVPALSRHERRQDGLVHRARRVERQRGRPPTASTVEEAGARTRDGRGAARARLERRRDFPATRRLPPGARRAGAGPASPVDVQAGAVGLVVSGRLQPADPAARRHVENAPQIASTRTATAGSTSRRRRPTRRSLDIATARSRYRRRTASRAASPSGTSRPTRRIRLVAALEDATFAPALEAAPFAGGDGTDSARASLVAFVNGQTGAGNPPAPGPQLGPARRPRPAERARWKPNQGRYSPLWDVHPASGARPPSRPAPTRARRGRRGRGARRARARSPAPAGRAFGACRVHRRLPDRQRGPITRLHSGAWMPTRSMRSSCRRSPRGSRTPRRPSWAGSSRAPWSRRPTSARCSSGKR